LAKPLSPSTHPSPIPHDPSPISSGFLDPALQIAPDELPGEHDLGIVFGRVLDLLEVIQPAEAVDAIDRGNQPYRALRIGVEVLMVGVGGEVDQGAGVPFGTVQI